MEEFIVVSEEKKEISAKKDGQISLGQAILLNGFIVALAIIIGAFIVHGSFDGVGNRAQKSAGTQTALTPNIKNVKFAGEPFIGNPNAKTAIAYWSDYQCPVCKRFETAVLPDVIKKYVASGQVAVVFKDYAFLGPDSLTAALYARSIWKLYPDQYFAWRTAMYTAQDEENKGFGNEASIKTLTASISGVDAAKVADDVQKNTDAYTQAITADRTEGIQFGITGTPSLITGQQIFKGLPEYAALATSLDKQL